MRELLLLISMILSISVSAQIKIRDVFTSIPDSLLPSLKTNARLDMLDFYDSHMKAEVTNELNGKSELTYMSDNIIRLQLTQSSQLEICLLDVNTPVDSIHQIAGVIKTYGTDIRESIIALYSLKWRKLPLPERLTLPSGMFVASFSREKPTITLTFDKKTENPIFESQEKGTELLKSLNWDGLTFNEY